MIKAAIKTFASVFQAQKEGHPFHPSLTCPECGSKLWQPDADKSQCASLPGWQCPNLDCPAKVRQTLTHWCAPDVMDIEGVTETLIATLVEKGLVRDVAEFYRLKASELAALPGMDKTGAQKIFDAITASMKRDAWRLLFGLSIPLVGKAEAEALARGFPTVDAVFAAGGPRLIKEAGVSETVAQSIVRWHSDSVNRKLVKRLLKIGRTSNQNFIKSPFYRVVPEKPPSSCPAQKESSPLADDRE